jgi:20S proteasome alpha/beta subunit
MTIALGIIALDGIVIAADRQESYSGIQQTSQGKVSAAFKIDPRSGILISGAGSSTHIDSLSGKLREWFCDDKNEDIKEIRALIEEKNEDFYSRKVLPVTSNPDDYGPDYSLLVACSSGGTKRLWSTDKLALNEESFFCALGLGGATAKALVGKLFCFMPVVNAINLAAFVIHEVKKTVEGCGLETDIAYLWQDAPFFVPSKEIREMDDAFERLKAVGRWQFHDCIASDTSSDPRLVPDNMKKEQSEIREIFVRLNSVRFSKQQEILDALARNETASPAKRPE